MSVFDKDTFLSTEIKGANEVKYTPVPEGEYHNNYIDDLGTDEYQEQPILIVTYALPDENLKKVLGMDKPTVQDRIFLDVDSAGNLLFGPNKNVKLGRLREAVGQNDPKKPWNMNMLRGAGPVSLKVSHNYHKTTGEGPFARIDRVVKSA